MSTTNNIAKNTILIFCARGLNAAFGFLTIILVARYLGVEGYGNYVFVIALISFTVLLADFGNFQIITRELSSGRHTPQDIIGSVFILRTLISIVLVVLILLIVHLMHIDSSAKMAVYIVTIPQLIFSLNTIFVATFSAYNRFWFDAMMQITSKVVELLLIAIVIIFNLWFKTLFVAIGIANLLNGVLGTIIYLRNI